ncbi:LuxR C-terminal-related transcriptional regulator [Microbacterium sp. Bi128]|uniref:ATP-binding protein n=1 Tax=Microbacterium sp. Bi128 TaxID=2821115 RepID=UPI001DE751C6|nr:LuxR C-terminal-related transcriptional regulator [Microbacterium sp. Bi128]CAH0235833.1 Putative HTH-type transcriptional regulator Rv0890c [Microbacterium sp. Bi128]
MIREPRSEFVGRRRELESLAGELAHARLVTLTGVGGVGKTRLAVRAANAHALRTSTSVFFVGLDAVSDPRRVAEAIAHALPYGELSARGPLEFIIDVLSGETALIVLDNCEHLIDAVASVVDDLLDALPRVTIVATSRRRLDVDGEQVFAVPPLTTDAAGDEPADAVALLVARARAGDSGFALAPAEVAAAAQLCRALDGLPLAIELAAARLRTLSVVELGRRLSQRFTLLRAGTRAPVSRQRTLRAVVDWSYELCTPAERGLWAALSMFSGPFDLKAAVAVAGGDDAATVDTLDQLIEQSVVEADRDSGRFHLLETIRSYGRDRAEEAGDQPRLVRRHLEHYAGLARLARTHWYGPAQRKILGGQRADRAELDAALRTAVALDTDRALELFSDLRYHWGVGGFLTEGRRWARRLLALPGGSASARVPALLVAAWLCVLQGALEETQAHLDDAQALLPLVPEAEVGLCEVELRRWNGSRALFAGEGERARDELLRSIGLARALGRPEEALVAQFQLTVTRTQLGLADAAAPAREALRYAESIDERWVRSLAMWAIALALYADGDLDEAERHARDALVLEEGIDDPVGDCLVLELLGWIDAARSPTERTAVLLGAALSWWRRIDSGIAVHGPHMVAQHDRCVAVVRQRLGDEAFQRLSAIGERLSPAEAAAFAGAPGRPAAGLSARESEVAAGIHEGLSNREIAERLVLSVRTVDTHVQRILAKLGFTSRAQIAAWYQSTLSAVR